MHMCMWMIGLLELLDFFDLADLDSPIVASMYVHLFHLRCDHIACQLIEHEMYNISILFYL